MDNILKIVWFVLLGAILVSITPEIFENLKQYEYGFLMRIGYTTMITVAATVLMSIVVTALKFCLEVIFEY
jgi:hypothetical protein